MNFLKAARAKLGLTKYALAKLVGTEYGSYVYYETKAKGMEFATLVKMKRKLGYTWERLGLSIEEEFGEDEKK